LPYANDSAVASEFLIEDGRMREDCEIKFFMNLIELYKQYIKQSYDPLI
jgi:hypothetical protein